MQPDSKKQKKGRSDQNGPTRRDFLIRAFECAPLAFVAGRLPGKSAPVSLGSQPLRFPASQPSAPEYRFSPHYRQESALADLLRTVRPGFDQFATEKYAEEIGAVLAKWTSGLEQSPPNLGGIVQSLASGLRAASLTPLEHQPLRPATGLEVYRNRFSDALTLTRSEFVREVDSFLAPFSSFQTAEFRITSVSVIDSSTDNAAIGIKVRYDLVGPGTKSYRSQKVGYWSLEWEKHGTGDWAARSWVPLEETESHADAPIFVDVTDRACGSVRSYREQLSHGSDYWRSIFDGASGIDVYGHNGIAVGDIDNDGFDDVYICQPSGLPNLLYRNRGDGTFEDVTEASGAGVLDNTACALFADIDNDGRQDLIVVTVENPLLFINLGNGRFEHHPDAFRFARPPQGAFTGAAVADYDRDGKLDVYFCLYSYYQGLDQYQVPTPFYDARNGPPNFLMHNNGDRTFADATEASGMNQDNDRYSFTCGWTDYNADGWPDLYVVNDFGRKNLYRNNGNGTFTDVAGEAGVDDVGAGMSVAWFDCDNHGRQDLYVADMWSAAGERVTNQDNFLQDAPPEVRAMVRKHTRGNSLFRNQQTGRFDDVSSTAGIEMGRWSWSSDAWDFDHDGFQDLYIADGMISAPDSYELSSFFWRQVVAKTPFETRPARAYRQGWNAINELIRSDGTWAGYQRNVFYSNNRDGTFSDISGTAGLDFVEDGRAFALADFDHDGRLEILLKNRNAPQLRILKNVMPNLGSSLAIRLRGTKGNRDAIGASVVVEAGALRQGKFLQAGSGFLSQHTKEVFFGVGDAKGPVRVTIRWPNGNHQQFENVPANHRILIEEGSDSFSVEPFRPSPAPAHRPTAYPPAENLIENGPSSAETWLLVPVAAPGFSLQDLEGRKRTLADFHGEPLLLTFWATSSASSCKQLSTLDRLRPALKMAAVSVDAPKDADRVRGFAREQRTRLPILLASEDTAAVYNILFRYLFDRHKDLPLPTSFLIDGQGRIVKVYQRFVDPKLFGDDALHIPRSASERQEKAFPFPGKWYGGDFHRNEFTYASVFLERGYLDTALAFCRLVLENDASSAEAYYLLGTIYLKKQQPQEARANFERSLKLPPIYFDTAPDAWNNLGMLAIQEGHADEAIKNFQQALRLSPNHVIALQNLGNVYREQSQWAEAMSKLQLAVRLDPEDAEANYGLAMAYAGQDDTESAYEYLQRALKLRPRYPEALNNLGILYARTGRMTEAIATFAQCIQVAPDFDQPYLNLARAYAVEGQPEKARDVLHRLLEQHPGDELAIRALAELGN